MLISRVIVSVPVTVNGLPFKWKPVMSSVPQASPETFVQTGMTYTFSKTWENMKLNGALNNTGEKWCHPQGPWSTWGIGLWEPNQAPQGQVQGPVTIPVLYCSTTCTATIINSHQDRHGDEQTESTEKYLSDEKRNVRSLLWKQAESWGCLTRRGEGSREIFHYIKGNYNKVWKRLFTKACSGRSRASHFKLEKGRSRLDVRRHLLWWR